ncbi:protein of unknown function [Methylorubrum extorquens DM4]|uniref:Uncharacterized protein n=1 Tax=Methylorubrum extorquens (strain DSM 6343 / CIP 106787 / DM4) TaxID=661410 RepID=C7C9A5_METED|nr:hypothetical protein [Methylorubrum extorquens]CAX22071.1 protein of unknown function [Methylorubrum extorquens DM4]
MVYGGQLRFGFEGAVAFCDAAPAAEARFGVYLDAIAVGEIVFAAGSKNGSFYMFPNAKLNWASGARFRVLSPSVQDEQLRGLEFAIPYTYYAA